MGFYIMLLTVHTTQGQGQGQGTIFLIVPAPFPVPVPVLVPCSVYEPLVSRPEVIRCILPGLNTVEIGNGGLEFKMTKMRGGGGAADPLDTRVPCNFMNPEKRFTILAGACHCRVLHLLHRTR